MFGRFIGVFKASEAGVIIKEAFKTLPTYPMLPFDPDQLALKLVSLIYAENPALFDGKRGPRPHAVVTAAVALANGLTAVEYEFPYPARQCVFLALGKVLIDISADVGGYRFSRLDVELVHAAERAYIQFDEDHRTEQQRVLNSLATPPAEVRNSKQDIPPDIALRLSSLSSTIDRLSGLGNK